jgi:hypothetical protein
MEITVTIISSISTIIVALISASAYIRGRKEEAKAKLNEKKKELAQQVIAYYCEVQILLEELAKTTGKNGETLKKEMRKKAISHEKNVGGFEPEMTPSLAKKYL